MQPSCQEAVTCQTDIDFLVHLDSAGFCIDRVSVLDLVSDITRQNNDFLDGLFKYISNFAVQNNMLQVRLELTTPA